MGYMTKPDARGLTLIVNTIEDIERESLNLKRKRLRAKANRNIGQLERLERKQRAFMVKIAFLRSMLLGWQHGYVLAMKVDRLQQERKVPRTIAFRKSYSSESWTEKYSR
jgi:hypothetical protein